jgi:hypothetical protein
MISEEFGIKRGKLQRHGAHDLCGNLLGVEKNHRLY